MTQQFDSDIAEKYGIIEAIFLNYIKSETLRKTFPLCLVKHTEIIISYPTISKHMPYVSLSTIKRAISHLKSEGLIDVVISCEGGYGRINRYSLTEKGIALVFL